MIHSEFFCFPSDHWSSTTNKTYAVEFVILQEEHKHDLSMYKISIDGLNWFLLVCLAFWALCLMESFKESEVQRMLWQLWSSLENVFCFCFFFVFFCSANCCSHTEHQNNFWFPLWSIWSHCTCTSRHFIIHMCPSTTCKNKAQAPSSETLRQCQ